MLLKLFDDLVIVAGIEDLLYMEGSNGPFIQEIVREDNMVGSIDLSIPINGYCDA
jgi:hypothetical protein